ncbi:gem-associated protein 2 [Astyanax mexicanus]|uniref:Gem-associated protein 2 n=2 Tax=Astyanax mexicanus TaxID=7994 RepID=A0A8T2LC43_ASTMX|nr:gem-associated protein 2 [Astyanax mexicanus]KAG9268959.1 gem-associated protein 2 [Astyanax mexicanus]
MEELMPRLLPVEPRAQEEEEGYTLKEPPRNPQEYLRHVQREASLCPDVVVAQIDPKKLRKNQSVNVSLSGCRTAPHGFSPSLKWQQQQVSSFSEVRQSVAKHRQHWKAQFLDDNVVMPKPDDEDGWRRFCLGENVYLNVTHSEDRVSPGLDYVKMGFPPFLSIVSKLSQSTVSAVLEYLISWFEERDFVPQLGQWLYALLACLEKPLLPEAHSLIRQLARRCSAVRANLESKDDDRLSALNLLICIVARYFEQIDLADKE